MIKKRINTISWILPVIVLLAFSACTTPENIQEPTRLSSGGSGTSESGGPMGTQPSNMPVTGSEIDEQFINMMVPHHQGAVEMARIALERSQRPEIKEMANAIIASQEAEITQMKGWKQQWYGSSDTPPMSEMPMLQTMPGMGMGHPMDMQADVDALQNAPEPFDLAFIDAMIPHHQSAIDAALLVINEAVHPEMRELAQQVIDAQQKEIDQMMSWRQEWYPDAPALENTIS